MRMLLIYRYMALTNNQILISIHQIDDIKIFYFFLSNKIQYLVNYF
jgi:hypothetical protein